MSTFPSHDWCAQDSLIIPWSMCVNRPAVCVTVMLLLSVAHSKRACDYSEIIRTYRALILVELQNRSLTGPFDISKERDHCPSEKVHRILRYIYGMTQIFSCLSESKRQQVDHMTEMVSQMQRLIAQNCRLERLAKKSVSCKRKKRKERQRKERREKMMGMLINCWQRLLSVTAY